MVRIIFVKYEQKRVASGHMVVAFATVLVIIFICNSVLRRM
jgi:hypothetical protein